MRTEDGYIVRECLDGDKSAFALLIDKYKSAVFAIAYSKLLNFHDAEDIAQEVFIKAYQKLGTLKNYDKFIAWLHCITNNLCKDYIRSHSKQPDREFIEDQEASVLDKPSMESYKDGLANELIYDALNSLPEIYRQVITMHYLGGMKDSEIAEFLGMSHSNVRQKLMKARMQLKEEMIAMMGTTFNEQKLHATFTFRIVEIVKRIKIQPTSTLKGLPWGLSFAVGAIITIMSINPTLISFDHIGTPIYSPLPVESKVLKVGEIPVDVVKTSNISVLSGKMGTGKGGEPENMQNAFLMAPRGEGGTWTKKGDMPNPRMCCAVALNGKIYAIGGATGPNNILSTVEEYDPGKDTWTKKANMPTARYGMAIGVANGKIYVIGGVKDSYLSMVEEYDPEKDIWTRKADMPTARGYFSGSMVDEKIYVFGGYHINASGAAEGLSITEEYDPVTDKWTKKADIPGVRSFFSTNAVNGKIYVIGGCVEQNIYTAKVEEYDPLMDIWIRKADMPIVRKNLCTSVINGKIYAIGGISKDGGASKVVSAVAEYDPVIDKWTEKANLLADRHSIASGVVNGKIYAIGGFKDGAATIIDPAVEEYTPEGWQSAVSPQDKLPTKWGTMKHNR